MEKKGIDPFVYCEKGKGVEALEFGKVVDPFEYCGLKNQDAFDVEKSLQNVVENGIYTEDFVVSKSLEMVATGIQKNVPSTGVQKPFLEGYPAKNFYIKPLIRLIYIDRKGNERYDMEEIKSMILINNEQYELKIKTAEIKSLCKIITRRFAEAIINYEEKNAEKIIESQFRSEVQFCKKSCIFFQTGWQVIGRCRVYLRDGIGLGEGMKAETGMMLPAYQWDEKTVVETFRRAFGLYRDMNNMYTMAAFSLMGVLFQPFKDAGHAPHFTLFLNGKSGSMKSTIAKILFVQLCKDEFRDNPRRIDADSAVSLERAVVDAGYHTVTLIDDFSPAKTVMKKNEMQDKLEMIIRMVGDGSSRSRSNLKLEDIHGEGVQGMVVLTGELMGKGLSSNLRCLYCKMEREKANEEMVTWFQENPYAYTTFIANFADFIGCNYESVMQYIKKKFNEERKIVSALLRERRLIDSAVTLRIACNILADFFKVYGKMECDEVTELLNAMQVGIVHCAYVSQEISSEDSPAIKYVRAIDSLMQIRDIVLSGDKAVLAGKTEFDGFYDVDFFYFNPDVIHRKIVKFLRQINCYFPFELREILEMLADDKIIKTASNGSGKRTLCVRVSLGNGVRHNFMKIERAVFNDINERINF